MNNPITVDLFVEDRAHEEFLKPFVSRIAREERVLVSIQVRSARGGHGRAIQEYKLYQNLLKKFLWGNSWPNVIIVGIDGNCTTFSKKRDEILKATEPDFKDRLVFACPDPHIEKWYLSDPISFHRVVGYTPKVGKKKCERDYYKKMLVQAIQRAGHPISLGGSEFAIDLVDAMDLYRASHGNHCLKAFVDQLRGKFK